MRAGAPGSRGGAAGPDSAGVPGSPSASRGRSGAAPLQELPRGARGYRAAAPPSASPSGSGPDRGVPAPPAGSRPQRYPRAPSPPPGPAPLTGRGSPVPQVQDGSAARPASGSDFAQSGATCAGAEGPGCGARTTVPSVPRARHCACSARASASRGREERGVGP